jgi:adenylate cyclase
MVESSKPSIQIDLNEFKLHLHFQKQNRLTLHFNSPSRKFYLSLIAFVVQEMKKSGKVKSVLLQDHVDVLALLNETVGGAAGSSDRQNMLQRIYRKWKDALPNLEEAPLFRVLGRKKEEEDGGSGKVYSFDDSVKDGWANLFEYLGSDENVRLKFAIDRIGVGLNETSIVFGDFQNGEAWDQFIAGLQRGRREEGGGAEEPAEEVANSESPAAPFPRERKPLPFFRYRWALPAAIVGILGAAIWKIFLSPAPIEVASVARMKYPLPDRPSIAVLPFLNMSKDPDQEYFSDGITEELIADLSKISGVMVIARNSTFPYKGKTVKIKQVAEELGVRYILEGSVRRAGEEVRINAQLIDALTGHHLWAERYDGTTAKIFVLQDQITRKIVNALAVKLTGKEKEQLGEKGTESVAAHDEFLKGWGHYFRLTPDDAAKAKQSFKKAIELDPNYSRPYAALALLHWTAANHPALLPGLRMDFHEARLRAREFLKKAMTNPSAIAYNVSSQVYLYRRQHEKAVSEIEKALALDPNDPSCHQTMAFILNMAGKPNEAMEFIEKGMRLDPHNPSRYLWLLGWAHFNRGDFTEAANSVEKALRLNPENEGIKMQLAAFYGLIGREQEGREAIQTVKRKYEKYGYVFTLTNQMYGFPFMDPKFAKKYAEGLLKSGLPPGKVTGGYFPLFKENQLSGDEIRKVLFGSKVTGFGWDGQPWWVDRRQDGDFTWRGPEPIPFDTGKSRIDGDMICVQFQKRYWGLENCGTVFRNPGGGNAGKDEYANCYDAGLAPFSVGK